jgi:hypothetical protein
MLIQSSGSALSVNFRGALDRSHLEFLFVQITLFPCNVYRERLSGQALLL